MKRLVISAPNKESLEKQINLYFYSYHYKINDDLTIYNTKLKKYLEGYTIVISKNRYKLYKD